jgi:hypothetical protein
MLPDWKKCTWPSTSPGITHLPVPSMRVAPGGILVEARAPNR